eukprot:COSAG05_NODE_60_length_23142_cov_25.372130_3_plen_63_part_00
MGCTTVHTTKNYVEVTLVIEIFSKTEREISCVAAALLRGSRGLYACSREWAKLLEMVTQISN